MTIRTGSRSSRRCHRRPRTASAASACSSRVPSEPRSTTTQRAAGSSITSSERARPAGAPTAPKRSTPRLRARSARRCASGRGDASSASTVGGGPRRAARRAPRAPRGRRSGRGAAARLARPARAPRAGAAAAARPPARPECTDDAARRAAVALRPSRRRRPSRTVRQPDEVGVGIEHDDPQLRLEQQLLEDHAERVRLAGARLPAQERVAVEPAGVERARHVRRERELADLQRRARGRAAARSHARISSGVAGLTVASWIGVPSPSRIAPSPRAWRMTTCVRMPPAASLVGRQIQLGAVALRRARARGPGRAARVPSCSSTT